MNNVTRFGVIKVGQIWSVIGDDGDKLNFLSRERALAAARNLAGVQRAFGKKVELLAQNELNELRQDEDTRNETEIP